MQPTTPREHLEESHRPMIEAEAALARGIEPAAAAHALLEAVVDHRSYRTAMEADTLFGTVDEALLYGAECASDSSMLDNEPALPRDPAMRAGWIAEALAATPESLQAALEARRKAKVVVAFRGK